MEHLLRGDATDHALPPCERELLGFRQAFVRGAFEAERCEQVAAAQPMLQLRRLREKVNELFAVADLHAVHHLRGARVGGLRLT
jgi:hypothetical protein